MDLKWTLIFKCQELKNTKTLHKDNTSFTNEIDKKYQNGFTTIDLYPYK